MTAIRRRTSRIATASGQGVALSRVRLAPVAIAVLLAAMHATVVRGAPPAQVLPTDVPVVASVEPDGTYVATVRLWVDSTAEELVAWTSPLTNTEDSDRLLEPPDVSISPEGPHQSGDIVTVTLDGSDAVVPGTYGGTLVIGLPNEAPTEGIQVTISLTVPTSEVVLAASQTVNFDLIQCAIAWECWLAQQLVPGSRPSEWPVLIRNEGNTPATVAEAVVNVRGSVTGATLAILSSESTDIAPDRTSEAQFNVDLVANTTPDEYSGEARVPVERQDALSIPVDVNIRAGPFLAIGVLLLSLLLGLASRFVKGKAAKLEAMTRRYDSIRVKVLRSPQRDQEALAPRMNQLAEFIADNESSEFDAAATLAEKWIGLLDRVRAVEARLRPHLAQHAADVQPHLTALEAGRPGARNVGADYTAEFEDIVTRAEQKANSLPAAPPAAAGVGAPAHAVPMYRRPLVVTILPFVRWLLYFAVVLGLLVLGMNELYVDKPAFGSAGLGDYAVVAAWGFSAERISGALAQVQDRGAD